MVTTLYLMPHTLSPISPKAQAHVPCPMPNAQCPMPHAPCPMPKCPMLHMLHATFY